MHHTGWLHKLCMTGCWSHWLRLEHGGGWLMNEGENLVNKYKSLLIFPPDPHFPPVVAYKHQPWLLFFFFFSPVPNMCTYASSIALSLSCQLVMFHVIKPSLCYFSFPAVFRPSESSPTTAAWTTWTASAAPAPLCHAGTTTTSARPAAPWADGAASDRLAPATQALFEWSAFQNNSHSRSVGLGRGGRTVNNRDFLLICSFFLFFLRDLYLFHLNSCRCHANLIH